MGSPLSGAPVDQHVHRAAQREVEDLGEGGADRRQDRLHPPDRPDPLTDQVLTAVDQHRQPGLDRVDQPEGGEVVADPQGLGDDEGVTGVGLRPPWNTDTIRDVRVPVMDGRSTLRACMAPVPTSEAQIDEIVRRLERCYGCPRSSPARSARCALVDQTAEGRASTTVSELVDAAVAALGSSPISGPVSQLDP